MPSPRLAASAAHIASTRAVPESSMRRRYPTVSGRTDRGTLRAMADRPLASYATLAAAFNAGLGAALVTAARRGRLDRRLGVDDVVRMGFATHKISRLVSKSAVTGFIRAPFVHLDEESGSNSVQESPRGSGLRRSVGELLTCPECTDQWVAGGLLAGLLHAPRTTRAVTSLYTALALADLLQYVYAGTKRRA